jgi:hypothetical protein
MGKEIFIQIISTLSAAIIIGGFSWIRKNYNNFKPLIITIVLAILFIIAIGFPIVAIALIYNYLPLSKLFVLRICYQFCILSLNLYNVMGIIKGLIELKHIKRIK